MLDPIRKSIEVPCSQKMAFEVFLDGMDTWWPLDKFTHSAMRGGPAKAIRVDPKVGGKIVEIGHDDAEVLWGEIKTYDPYDGFSMDFHVPAPGFDVDGFTFVEVRFTAIAERKTRVELTQTEWEFLGDMAEGVRGGYVKGWSMIFEQAYAAACSR